MGRDVGSQGTPIISLGHNLISATDGSVGWQPSDDIGTIASPLNPLLAAGCRQLQRPHSERWLPLGRQPDHRRPATTPAAPSADQRGFTRGAEALAPTIGSA